MFQEESVPRGEWGRGEDEVGEVGRSCGVSESIVRSLEFILGVMGEFVAGT